jgi:hypothetical protein
MCDMMQTADLTGYRATCICPKSGPVLHFENC